MNDPNMHNAVIVCLDCKKVITTVREHFMKNSFNKIILSPMNKQFPDHLDHDLSIMIPNENEK